MSPTACSCFCDPYFGIVGSFQMEGRFSGIVRVAVLPHPWDKDSEKTLTRHAYAYPRGGRVTFAVNGDEMEMR